ncbi:MAG: HpcH/HpaI aldolase/citrate lyase family protein [Desulfobacterales bacterium]|nr:MAG: HpcH/HpaI aldolase/citrate lyase family protein [Desulfobacterales bacterium]
MAKTFENPLKTALKNGKKTLGAWLQLASPMTAEIMSRAGFDWLLVDMEHGAGDLSALFAQLQAMNGTDTVPVVRAPWNDFVVLKRILDAGAYGVLIPYVNTKSQAEAAVAACKYPPEGIRGIAGSTRATSYGLNTRGYLDRANDEILVITQIETPEAISNLDEILEVPGLDGVFIGPMDLATNMGHLGDPSHSEVQAAIAAVEAKVCASPKVLGTLTGTWEQAKKLYSRGYQLVTVMADGLALAGIAAEKVALFRKEFPEG